jgi:hypothetical protein
VSQDRHAPYVIHSHGMVDRSKRAARDNLEENMEIIRQCEEAAAEISDRFPIAARLLQQEAQSWRGM